MEVQTQAVPIYLNLDIIEYHIAFILVITLSRRPVLMEKGEFNPN